MCVCVCVFQVCQAPECPCGRGSQGRPGRLHGAEKVSRLRPRAPSLLPGSEPEDFLCHWSVWLRCPHSDSFFLRRSTVSSILGAWLDQYSEDFWSPPNHDCLHQLLSYLRRHFLGSDLERRARNLLAHFLRRQQCEPDPDGMKAGQERDNRPAEKLS